MVIHIEIYLAAKQLQWEGIESFSSAELQKKIAEMFGERKAGTPVIINSLCNASAPKNHATVYNYLVRIGPGRYRLYKDGDEIDPSRKGAVTRPMLDDVPAEYWPLWAEKENEAPIQFNGFREENFSLFEIEQKTYTQGDPIDEKFKSKWIEWKQFVQIVVNHIGNKFNYATEQRQDSGFLNNKYYWSMLKDKGWDNFATCISLAINKNKLVINLYM